MGEAATKIGVAKRHLWLITGVIAALAGSLLLPGGAFTIDEALYIDMAYAMAERGSFDITAPDIPDGSPVPIKSDNLVRAIDGRAVPQYPGIYALIAAPFFAALGLKGLVFLNALSAVLCLWLTHKIARRLGADAWAARASIVLLGGASIFAGYVFAVWPHALSLSFILAGAYHIAAAGDDHKRPWMSALIAGLFFGIGAGIRVDVILSAVAGFFWLRIFASPSNRVNALALLTGLLPGLLLAAVINANKFGVFNPFTYGHSSGGAALSTYIVSVGAIGAIAALALLVDVSKNPWARIAPLLRQQRPAVLIAAIVIALILFWLVMPRLLHGLYVLLIDIQAFAGGDRIGQTKDQYGYWNFWGLPKKALIQSMPYLALIILPVAGFFKGIKTRSTSYLLLFAAAPICFFALNSWHGGMAFNLRYYLPAVPFLLVLAADGLTDLRNIYREQPDLMRRSLLGGVVIAVATYVVAPLYGPVLDRPLQLYAPIALAAVLLIACSALLLGWHKRQSVIAIAALASAGIGYAGMISVSDAIGYTNIRMRNASLDRAYHQVIPGNALVFAQIAETLPRTAITGAAIFHLSEDNKSDALKTLTAYANDGRCIYAQTGSAEMLLGQALFIPLDIPENATPFDRLNLYKDSPEACGKPRH